MRMSAAEMRVLRTRIGLSQSQAARMIGVPVRTWQGWEQEENPISEPVARLLRACMLPAVRERVEYHGGRMLGVRYPKTEAWSD